MRLGCGGVACFFFDLVRGIIDGYPTLFGTDDEQDGEQEGTEADAEADAEGGSGFADKWGWISCIDAVSGTARCSWDAATDMPVVAFCNILAYRNDKIAEEERQHREWLRKH